VAHSCNPSYSEGRDQEDLCSKSAQANNLRDPISKKYPTHTNKKKTRLEEWLKWYSACYPSTKRKEKRL
jgi:hypothetical protein